MPTWADLRRDAEARLRDAPVAAPDTEARWMVERVSGYDGVELVMGEHEDATAPGDRAPRRHARTPHRRASRCSTCSGAGTSSGSTCSSTAACSCPRPETEVVATHRDRGGAAGSELRRGRGDPWAGTAANEVVVDLGTGSGALALALASELPDAEVWATDVSDDALAVARGERRGHGRRRCHTGARRQGSWYDALPTESPRPRARIVVSNPPYVVRARGG